MNALAAAAESDLEEGYKAKAGVSVMMPTGKVVDFSYRHPGLSLKSIFKFGFICDRQRDHRLALNRKKPFRIVTP